MSKQEQTKLHPLDTPSPVLPRAIPKRIALVVYVATNEYRNEALELQRSATPAVYMSPASDYTIRGPVLLVVERVISAVDLTTEDNESSAKLALGTCNINTVQWIQTGPTTGFGHVPPQLNPYFPT